MAAARQPQTGELVIDEQQLSALLIDEREIAHKMHRRHVGLCRPENRPTRTDPIDRGVAMRPLEVVERLDCRNQVGDIVAHSVHTPYLEAEYRPRNLRTTH